MLLSTFQKIHKTATPIVARTSEKARLIAPPRTFTHSGLSSPRPGLRSPRTGLQAPTWGAKISAGVIVVALPDIQEDTRTSPIVIIRVSDGVTRTKAQPGSVNAAKRTSAALAGTLTLPHHNPQSKYQKERRDHKVAPKSIDWKHHSLKRASEKHFQSSWRFQCPPHTTGSGLEREPPPQHQYLEVDSPKLSRHR